MAKRELKVNLEELKALVQEKINEGYVPYKRWKTYDKEKRNSIEDMIADKYQISKKSADVIMSHPEIKEILKQVKRSSTTTKIVFV